MKDYFLLSDLSDSELNGKRVLLRVDCNVPVDENGHILNDSKIRSSLPTVKYILEKGAKVIIINHIGRPKGKVVSYLKMDNVASRFSKLLKKKVTKLDGCYDLNMPSVDLICLENLRMFPGEENNSKVFAKKLANYADYYVNDAFAVSHRKHMSIDAITNFLPSYAGLLFEKEIKSLDKVINNPKKPFVIISGGKKLSDKFPILNHFVDRADYILLGGAMIFTFYKALGLEIGKSLYEDSQLRNAKQLLKHKNIILPTDIAVAKDRDSLERKVVSFDKISSNEIGLDIGDKSIAEFKNYLKDAKIIIWNGPLGYFENKKFAKGSKEIANYISKIKNAYIVVGGGETIELINELGVSKNINVCTGGGAMLEYFANCGRFPGIEALKTNHEKYNSKLT